MSASMLISTCNAPVYSTPNALEQIELVTDHRLLKKRATKEKLDELVLLIRSREDATNTALIEEPFEEEQLALFDYDRDGEPNIIPRRQIMAMLLLSHVLHQVFEEGSVENVAELNSEVTWLTLAVGDAKRALLVTGGLSFGDDATEISPAIELLDTLNLFAEPFLRPGSEPAPTLTDEELYAINDQLAAQLAERGWSANTEDDYVALDNLTHEVAAKQLAMTRQLDEFVAKHTPAE